MSRRWSLVFGVLLLPALAQADVKLPKVLSSQMVLQREAAVPIWGEAAAGEQVVVKFRDQEKTTVAGDNGKWSVKLDPLKAGGPDELVVRGKNTVTLENVLVGEVWVGSGQSNMQGAVGGYSKGDPVLAKQAEGGPYPKLRLLKANSAGWQVADEKSIPGFSAILFAFGLQLQKDLDVPVGLLVGAVGGTPSGYWLSQEAFDSDAACQTVIKKFAATYPYDDLLRKYEVAKAEWDKAAEAAKQKGEQPPKPPVAPKKAGEANGKIGNLYEAHIRQFQPFAIRGVLWDQGESGTAINGVDQYTLMGALIRGWRKEWGQGDFPFLYVQKPSGGGCAWDAADPITSQSEKFTALPATAPNDGGYRETHIRIREYPLTAMVTSSDLGPGIHPTNKSGYGQRATRVALGLVYGQKVAIYGPTFDSVKFEGGKARVSFQNVGQGLASKHGDKLQGFAIAGEDRVFHWADATIEGDSVLLTSEKVASPVAVRYAYASRHPWANLFNKDGLPALPFRSDAW